MPIKKTKRKASPEHKKYCWCTPFCNKKLTRQVRRRHYKQRPQQYGEAKDSETATESVKSTSSSEKKLSDTVETSSKTSDEDLHHQVGYDGSGEDEEQALEVDERGHSFDEDSDVNITSEDELEEQAQVEVEERGHSFDEDVKITIAAEYDEEHTGSGEESDATSNSEGLASEGGQGFEDDHGLEFDEWKEYCEDEETAALHSDEERLREFDDILGPEEHAELWESRLCFTF
jgi:hypothetical protein